MELDLLVRNARIVHPDQGVVDGDLGVSNGLIVGVVDGLRVQAARILHAEGKYLLPGVIDPHTHPGLVAPLRSRWPLESRSAAAGGVTTLISYLRRLESYHTVVPDRISVAQAALLQDYTFHLTLFNDRHLAEIPEYIRKLGVTSFKIYMNSRMPLAKRMRMDALDHQATVETAAVDFDLDFLVRVFEALHPVRHGIRLNVHCEDSEVIAAATSRISGTGRRGLAAWNEARPPISESLAIHQAAALSRAYAVPLYIPHIGNRTALQAVDEARILQTDVRAESCPHYLVLTDQAGEAAKVSPPIRSSADQEAIRDAIEDGRLDTLGSDEIPYRADEKAMSDFWEQNSAFSGSGLLLPIAVTSGLSITSIARVTSSNVAKCFGLYPRKGTLAEGSDADFTIIDVDHEHEVVAKDLQGSSDFSVYEGMTLRGWPTTTVSRGEIIFDAGRFPAAPGRGIFLRRDGASLSQSSVDLP